MTAVILLIAGLGFTACDNSTSENTSTAGTTGGATGYGITLLDGYIKDATVVDADGQVASYSGTGGKYTFSSQPTYPITASGGSYEETNVSVDINLSCTTGSVISPITTFLDGNETLANLFGDLGLNGGPYDVSEFSVDYIADPNSDLAKLAQLLAIVLKDPAMTQYLKENMPVFSITATTALEPAFTAVGQTITNAPTSLSIAQQGKLEDLLTAIANIDDTAVSPDQYESALEAAKLAAIFINWKGQEYGVVKSPYTGKVWLDRNLGASQVCTAVSDTNCYGDYYQWGREADGHEAVTSSLAGNLATAIITSTTTVNGRFVIGGALPKDWLEAGIDDNGDLRAQEWSATDGSSICPVGFRVPTPTELRDETLDSNQSITGFIYSSADAFDNFLKLPTAGQRASDGTVVFDGTYTRLWSNDKTPTDAKNIFIGSGAPGINSIERTTAFPVRCIQD